jgi:general secretion pathway protein B
MGGRPPLAEVAPPPEPAMAPQPRPATVPAPAPAPAPAGSAPQAAATPPVAGLPPDAPKLTITGGVYSADKAQRMLIVNGHVVAEGGDLGSGVTLEEIKPKTAVLRFRGARYSVGY